MPGSLGWPLRGFIAVAIYVERGPEIVGRKSVVSVAVTPPDRGCSDAQLQRFCLGLKWATELVLSSNSLPRAD